MNTRSHLFKVKRGRLYYDNKPIGTCKCHPGFERLYFEKDPLSEEGANGVIFRASHRILDIQQAVKVWRPEKASDFKRAKNEAKKNANRDLGNSVAHINDAGIYEYPSGIFFAIMEIVNNAKTLKEWVKVRNLSLRELESDEKTDKKRLQDLKLRSCAQALNVTSGLLLCIGTLYENEMTHGDLHAGNLLIPDNENTRTNLLQFTNIGTPGSLIPVDIRIIDIGTSEATGTNRQIGEMRDVDKIIQNTRDILSPLLTHFKTSLTEWLTLENVKKKPQGLSIWKHDNAPISPAILAGDLLRLTIVLNLIFGFATNAPNKKGYLRLEKDEVSAFNNSFSSKKISNMEISFKFGGSQNKLDYYSEISSGLSINWPKVWESIARKYPAITSYYITESVTGVYELKPTKQAQKSSK